jgi:hypothetical protein
MNCDDKIIKTHTEILASSGLNEKDRQTLGNSLAQSRLEGLEVSPSTIEMSIELLKGKMIADDAVAELYKKYAR